MCALMSEPVNAVSVSQTLSLDYDIMVPASILVMETPDSL